MTATIGHASLFVAFFVALWGISASIIGPRTTTERCFVSVKVAILAQFFLVTLGSLALIYALVTTDFSIKYVAFNTTRATPVYYRVTGLWGALEGSLLLWEWILIVFSGLVSWIYKDRHKDLMPWVLMIFSTVSAFFLAVLAFASNPFEGIFPIPMDGRGLNPLLEDADMITHPPLLYTGFVGLMVPYAFAMAALIKGKLDEAWIVTTRRWTITAWFFLTMGNLVRGMVVLSRPGLGRLLGVGPGGKRGFSAVAPGYGFSPFPPGPGAAPHAQGLESFAYHHRLQPDHFRHLSHPLRYGGFIVHLGIVLIVLGITGSMSYSVEQEATLQINEGLSVGRYYIQFEGLRGSQQPTHYRVEGSFRVFNEGHDLGAVSPTLKFFPNQQSSIGRAVFRSTLADDLYLILSGFSDLQENRATLKVLIRPLVVWIWIGGFVIVLGTLVAIWPNRKAPRKKVKMTCRDPRYIVSPLMGRQAPEFTLTLFDGNTTSLSNFPGRVACSPPRYTVSAGGR